MGTFTLEQTMGEQGSNDFHLGCHLLRPSLLLNTLSPTTTHADWCVSPLE